MICSKGWFKSLLIVLWEDKWLILRNLGKEVYRLITGKIK